MSEVRNLSFSYNTQTMHRLTLYPAVCCAKNPDTIKDISYMCDTLYRQISVFVQTNKGVSHIAVAKWFDVGH